MSCIHFLFLPCTCGNQLWRGCPRHEPSQIYVETTNGNWRCWSRWHYGRGYVTATRGCQCIWKYRKQRTIQNKCAKNRTRPSSSSDMTLSNRSMEPECDRIFEWLLSPSNILSPGTMALQTIAALVIRDARHWCHSELTRHSRPDASQSQEMTPNLVVILLYFLSCSSRPDKQTNSEWYYWASSERDTRQQYERCCDLGWARYWKN